jgi:3-hydroxyacyl-CoA dehydrogenase/enoyl-CoA hydratase/3-hydroxybutyryl-CoA epimerase
MSSLPPVSHLVDAEGVAWITLDDPSARANIFNPVMLSALRTTLAGLSAGLKNESPAVKAIVFISAKERIFTAGADLKWLAALPDAKTATLISLEGQAVFNQVAAFKIPVVCAIHGACAGGGYELALACTWRLATDAPETRIGLPEVGLGLIPGWGGCTRLARLIGAQPAAEFILKAALIPASVALSTGLIDELVPAGDLRAHAKAAALRLASMDIPLRPEPAAPPADFFPAQRQLALVRRRGQPAPLAVLEVMEKSAGLPLAAAFDKEAALFGSVVAGEVAKNLIHIFLIKARARKTTLKNWYSEPIAATPPVPFRTIGIVGAGVMGAGIAHWCAAHGYGVILCDSKKEAIERGVGVIRELFADGVQRGEVTADAAHRMTGGIGITTSLEDFEFCDLVIETIVEDVAAKQKLFGELSAVIQPDCVLASNSSTVPIDELASAVANPGRVIGLHFFNPVSRMPLVEVGLGAQTTRLTADRALDWVKALGKTPLICRPSPGYFVSRVLFFYLNEACRLWEQGVTTATLDQAMRDWGWPMGPMRLIDEIGIDVTDAVFERLAHFYPERFVGSTICRQLLAKGLKGRKNVAGAGFYEYVETEGILNPAIPQSGSGSANPLQVWETNAIQDRLNGVLIDETNRALTEGVVKTADDAQLALLLGAGFPAFRGSPLRYATEVALARS